MATSREPHPQFRPAGRQWTEERIGRLDRDEVEQLHENAINLGAAEVAALCAAALAQRPKQRAAACAKPPTARKLVSRAKAFEARGVYLEDSRASWGGVRKSDGAVVMALWAAGVQSARGGCAYLLWTPNIAGSHPWSDSAAGRERLEHCQAVMKGAAAEGLLVYGERLTGYPPEEKARSVYGVDVETLVRFGVEKRGEEYWAVWGRTRKRADAAPVS